MITAGTRATYRLHAPFGVLTRAVGSSRTRVQGVTEIVQGMDPETRAVYWGHLLFAPPPLAQVPAAGNVYVRATHWFYNDGGTGVLSVVDMNGVIVTDTLEVPRWPKPGGMTVELPEHWLAEFGPDGAGAGIGIGSPDQHFDDFRYYGKFDTRGAQLNLWIAP